MKIQDFLTISSPCPANWEEMTGDDKKRYCKLCSLHVYDLTVMSEEEVAQLVQEANEKDLRLCGQLYQRADGKVQLTDCPRGLAKIKEQSSKVYQKVAASLALFLGLSVSSKIEANEPVKLKGKIRAIMPWENTRGNAKGEQASLESKLTKMSQAGDWGDSRDFLESLLKLAKVHKKQADNIKDTKDANKLAQKRLESFQAINCLNYLKTRLTVGPEFARKQTDLLKDVETLLKEIKPVDQSCEEAPE
jgi:hypothetical protein